MENDRISELWVRISDELRKLRGSNRFRGSVFHILPRRIVRIPEENRESNFHQGEIVIHLTEAESELWAEHLPSRKKYLLRDFEYGLPEFMAVITDLCRGKEYMSTHSQSAGYRKKPDAAEPASKGEK